MIKTSTKQEQAKEHQQIEEDTGSQQDELYYEDLKQELNGLIKEPSFESVKKILSYSRTK
ncbi:MAG: hypothetical protein EOO43_18285 [Flavobacterium sp.]|nr:MAG: hypothetical protein EOO43_18285 [Flavobacterium sp.]